MRIKDIAPVILTVTSVVSSIAAVVMAVHDTPKAFEIADNHRLEKDPEGLEDLTIKEKIIDYGKAYWKTEALLALSIGTSIASCVIGHKNYRALMASTAVISTAYAKHKDKIKKFVGEEKAKLLNDEVKKEMLNYEGRHNTNELLWFYDTVSETYFQMTWANYLQAKLFANKDINTYGDVTLGNAFACSTLEKSMTDKAYANYTWFYDDLVENYGYPWLDITEEEVNFPGSENTNNDPDIRDGKPTIVIHYGMWPLPPSVARDYQYIGSGN